jgi:hypothetical protein
MRSNYHDTLDELAHRLHPTGAAFTPRGSMSTGRQEGTGLLAFNGVKIADARGIISEDPYGDGVVRRTHTAITGGIRGVRETQLHQDLPPASGMPDYFPRVTTDAMLETPAGNHVRVLGGHYNGPSDETDYQGAQVKPVAELADDWAGPTIWGADWNVRSGSAHGDSERAIMAAAGLHDSFDDVGIKPNDPKRHSFGDTPRVSIDRIYVSKQVGVDGVHVSPYPAGEPAASDHHPVVADLHLRPGQGAS